MKDFMTSAIDGSHLPYWYGIRDIGFVWRGEHSNPELEYQGVRLNAHDVEETMLCYYEIEHRVYDESLFALYIKEHTDEVYNILADLIDTGVYCIA